MKKLIRFVVAFVLILPALFSTKTFAMDNSSDNFGEVTVSAEHVKENPESVNSATLSEAEVLNCFYESTKERIDSIHNTNTTILPSNDGTAYYVSNSGKDTNDGLSPGTPIATISAVNKLNLKSGDVVYFERGGLWRGSVTAHTPGVTYSAYGHGNKPELYGSSYNYAKTGMWLQTDVPNIYKYSEKIEADVGNIVFDGGKTNGIKCVLEEKDGKIYNATTGKSFDTYADLDENLHFFHDSNATKELYLYCSDGNPAELYDSIEFAENRNIIDVGWRKDITVDNITFRYSGSAAVFAGSCDGLTVQNCEAYWIGGSIQYGSTRYGNGVTIYGAAWNFTVDNCYFSQIYDAAASFQFEDGPDSTAICQNIKFTNNVMEYCNYSVEYFLDSGKNEANYFKDFYISENHMWYAGYGLCSQRKDKGQDAHIKSWNHTNKSKGDFIISNNIFALAKKYLLETYSTDNSHGAAYDSNTYIQFKNHYFGRNGSTAYFSRFTDNVREDILQNYGDKNAKIIWVSNSSSTPNTKPTDTTGMIYGDVDGDGKVTINDGTLISKYINNLLSIPNEKLVLSDVNKDGSISVMDVTCIQKYITEFESGCGLAGQFYHDTNPTQPNPETYKLYLKTKLDWMTNDVVSLFAYDLNTEKSYTLEQIKSVYPYYIYEAELPNTVTDISVYRFTEAVEEPPTDILGDFGNVYSNWDATVSPTENCITISDNSLISTGTYVEDIPLDFSLSRVYFDNSKAKWLDVYVYGWAQSGLNGTAVLMKQIAGTDIWYYDFNTPILPGEKCFLFKDTETNWVNQTNDITVWSGMNCYIANEGNKTGGSWCFYEE